MTRVRVFIKIPSDDAYELKAQALNNDPRLKAAGISALKFEGDRRYIADGEFSDELPPPTTSETASVEGERLRVFLRIPSDDAYELKAQALNNDPRLKAAGISGVNLVKGGGAVVPSSQLSAAQRKKPGPARGRLFWGIVLGLIGLLLVVGVILAAPMLATPAAPVTATATTEAPVASTSTQTLVPVTSSFTPKPVVSTRTQTPAPSPITPTLTETATLVPAVSCVAPSQGTIVAENLSCRYGPGANYLYRAGLVKGEQVDILGRADTAYGTWVYVQTSWVDLQTQNKVKCWINSSPKYVEMQGDVSCLDSYYPEKAPLILFRTDLFPAPTEVYASRSGGYVSISWVGYELAPGDWPGPGSPRYLVEVWTCQNGKIVFSPIGTLDESVNVPDEAGCSEPSHGQVYLAHVDGYIGPSYITWPP